MKVLLDTDIGDNIDDVLCLAYLLRQPACELLAVTTVSGEASRRATLAQRICADAGADVPVAPGAERPLAAPRAEASSVWTTPALELMRRLIHENPGEVVLLAIGPLTNVATLFKVDPRAAAELRALVLMCGSFARGAPGRESPEHNARNDPQAAAIVYRTQVALHRSIGLNVTRRVRWTCEEVLAALEHEHLATALRLTRAWCRDRREVVLNDPLAAVTIFEPGVCSYESGRVEVTLGSGELDGTTIFRPGSRRDPHQVALDVDVSSCLAHLRAVLSVA
jgi:purine nucleosidase